MKISNYIMALAAILAPDCLLAAQPSSFERLFANVNEDVNEIADRQNESFYGRRNEVEEHWESQHRYALYDSGRIDLYSSPWQSSNERSGLQGEWRKNKKSRRSWNSE